MGRVEDISKRGRRKAEHTTAPLVGEEVDARIAESAKLFVEATRRTVVGRAGESAHRRTRPGAEAEAETFRVMRTFLGDELSIVAPLEGSDGIDPEERERQIARRALTKLTKVELQHAASSMGIAKRGTKDELLDRLILHVDGSIPAVSSLLNSVDRHTREGRRHASRLFVFEDLGDHEELAAALLPFQGRYVRTDVASWFVLRHVHATQDATVIDGERRAYDVTLDYPEIRPTETNIGVQLRVQRGESVLRAAARNEPETIAAVEAVAYFAQQLPLPPLSKVARSRPVWGHAGGLRVETTWLLGLLLGLLDHPTMMLRDVTSASFERSARDHTESLGSDVPHVGAARLRGQHVLDSQSACRHIASGERLRAVTAMVDFRNDDNSRSILPVRVAIERDYAAVMTGFGGIGANESRPLHRRIEDYVASQLIAPRVDEADLERVVAAMLSRAIEPEPPKVADLFARLHDAEIRLERA